MTALSLSWAPARAEPGLGAAAWLGLASFATVTQALMVPGLLPGLAEGLGTSVAEAGQATTAFALAAALGALPLARLLRLVPQDRVVVGGLAGLAAVNFLAALAPGLSALLALRVLAGLLAAAVLPAAPALAAALVAPALRVRALASVTFGSTLAFALGLPATSLVAARLGWPAAFVLAAGLCGGAALVIAARGVGLPHRPLSRAAGEGWGGGGATRHILAAILPTLLLVLLAFASVFATQGFLGPIADATLKGSPALLQAIVAIGALLGVPAGAALAERAPGRAAPAIAGSLLLAALWQWGLLAGGLSSPLLQAGQVVFASAALFAVSPVLQARLLHQAGAARTTAMAANFVAVSLGQALGAALGGFGLAQAGLAGAAAVGVTAAGLMLVLAVSGRR